MYILDLSLKFSRLSLFWINALSYAETQYTNMPLKIYGHYHSFVTRISLWFSKTDQQHKHNWSRPRDKIAALDLANEPYNDQAD